MVEAYKTRFGALKRAMDIIIDDLPFVIYACFVLYNFCESNKESISGVLVFIGNKHSELYILMFNVCLFTSDHDVCLYVMHMWEL